MRKRIFCLFTSLSLLLTLLPTAALATEGDTSEETTYELIDLGETVTSATPDYGISLMSVDDGNVDMTTSGVDWIDRVDLPDAIDAFYDALVEASDGDGQNDWLIDPTTANGAIQQADDSMVAKILEVTTTGEITEDASNYYYRCIRAVFDAFDRDHPEVFWLSGGTMTSRSGSSSDGGNTWTYTFYFVLTGEKDGQPFDVRDTTVYTDASAIQNAMNERDGYISAILADSVEFDGETLSYVPGDDYNNIRYFNRHSSPSFN